MDDFVTKVDNTSPPTGNLTAAEFNNYINELENTVTGSGQTLSGSSVIQLLAAIGWGGGKIITRANAETALFGEIVIPNNSVSVPTINLPALPFTDARVIFMQEFDQLFSAINAIVGRNSSTIGGLAEDMTLTIDNAVFMFRFNGTTWVPHIIGTVGQTL